MARTFAHATVTRALDAAMFSTPVGLPASAFRREVEHRLMDQCDFNSGMVGNRNVDRVRVGAWEEHRFRIGLTVKSPQG